jgi:hypothetical protein
VSDSLLLSRYSEEFSFAALCTDPREVAVVEEAVLEWSCRQPAYDEEWDVLERERKCHHKKIAHITFLFEDFRPQYWYFEVVEVLRMVMLSCIVVLYEPGTPSQLVFGVVVTLVSAGIKLGVRSFINISEDRYAMRRLLCRVRALCLLLVSYCCCAAESTPS